MRSHRTLLSTAKFVCTWHALLRCYALVLCVAIMLSFSSEAVLAQSNFGLSSAEQSANQTTKPSKESSDERTTRIRIAFGSDTPQIWQAEIEFRGAKPSQLQSLSLEPSSVGGAWLDGNRLLIQHDQPLRQNAYDVTLSGSIDAEIICRIKDETTSYEATTFNLHEVRRKPKSSSFGTSGRIVIERMVEDQFHIAFNKAKRIYEPNTQFQFEVKPDTESLAPGDFFDLHIELAEGRKGKTVWQADQKRYEVPQEGLPTCPVEIPLPATEGVYRVKLQVIRPAGFTSRFLSKGNSRPLAERSFQLLVMDSTARPEAPGDWEETYVHNPALPKSDRKFSEWIDWRKHTRNGESTIVSSLAEGAKLVEDKTQVELPPKDDSGAAHWQAYPLAISSPGKPYLVEVEFSSEASEQLLGLTLLDTNSNGELHELGETVVHQTSRWGDTKQKQIARILFWPSTNTPLLVLSNPSQRESSKYGKIRVLKATGSAEAVKDERTVAIEWKDVDVASQLGSSMAISPSNLYDYADLQTHFESAKRIADRVEIAGANTAVISINDMGAAVTPVDSLSGTPRFDMGTWALGISDIPRLDLLEVLLHEFDRRGLKLIPNVSLAGPLPSLERQKRQQRLAGINWNSPETPQQKTTPYNPLNPRVSQAIEQIGQELIAKYGKNDSLRQLAIRLDANSALMQPNQEGGFDTSTVDRFLADKQLSWPTNLPRTEANHATAIRENVGEPWQDWKREQMLSLHFKLGKAFSNKLPEKCLLIPHRLEANPLLLNSNLPRLGKTLNVVNSLEESGLLSLADTQISGGLALPLPIDQFDSSATTSQNVFSSSLEIAAKDDTKRLNTGARGLNASRFSYRLLDSAKLFAGKFNQQDLTVQCVVDSEAEMASTLASQLTLSKVTTILDGGSAAAGSYNESISSLRRLAAATPFGSNAQEEQNHELEDVSLLVTEVLRGKAPGSILIAANRTPWKRTAHITLSVPGRCLAIPISESPYDPEWYETGQHAMTIELGPNEALSWRFSTTGIKTTGIRVKPVSQAEEQLREGIERLKRVDRTARRSYELLRNPSFEELDDAGQTDDWIISGLARSPNEISAHEGVQSLQLVSAGEPCSATSAPFPLPETGQLAVLFHANAQELAPEAQLQIEMLTTDGKYSSQTTVRADQLLREAEGQAAWGELIFAVDDLPLEPLGEMQIRFTLTDRGQLNLDSLRCEDLMLPLPAYAEDLRSQKLALIQLTLSAEQALEEGRLADCQQTLDSYWARFLITHFPKIEPMIAAEPTTEDALDASEADIDEAEEESPSVADRLRGYWPKMWR